MRLFLLCSLLPLLLLWGCAPAVQPSKTAAEYYQEGEALYARGQYKDALEALEKAREIYETAELNMQAELKIADTHFAAKEYVEAAAAYEDFLKQHPGHPETSRVMYQLGTSHFNQILAIDRDQTATRNALVAFESLANLYPDDPRAGEAPERIRYCRDHLADNELYISRFYLKAEKYLAAIDRLSGLLENYPDYSRKDQVLFYLGLGYLEGGHPPLAALQFENLLQQFPQSELTDRTKDLLHEM
jgi:outer membrane protein assembly factor BamD